MPIYQIEYEGTSTIDAEDKDDAEYMFIQEFPRTIGLEIIEVKEIDD